MADPQLAALGAAVLAELPKHGRAVAEAVVAGVDSYEHAGLVSFDDLLTNCTAEVRMAIDALMGAPIDATGAQQIGRRRAEQGMPLPDVMRAYRLGCALIWELLVDEAHRLHVPDNALVAAATTIWDVQAAFVERLTIGYRDVVAERILKQEEESAALVGALLDGQVVEGLSLWEASDLLGLDRKSPIAVVVAEVTQPGSHALPGIRNALRVAGVRSAWRLAPGSEAGIVSIPGLEAGLDRLTTHLRRAALARVGVSPVQESLSGAPTGLRLARIAMLSATATSPVAVFGDDLIGAASVASGELLGPLTQRVLAGLDVLSADERDLLLLTFRTWVDQGGSATAAGAAIYCHPNTVRYRLRKLEELTGRSVSDPRSMVELLLAAEAEQRRAATT